jgi:hypothetical protein
MTVMEGVKDQAFLDDIAEQLGRLTARAAKRRSADLASAEGWRPGDPLSGEVAFRFWCEPRRRGTTRPVDLGRL